MIGGIKNQSPVTSHELPHVYIYTNYIIRLEYKQRVLGGSGDLGKEKVSPSGRLLFCNFLFHTIEEKRLEKGYIGLCQ